MLKLEWPMVDFKRKVINLPGRITKTKKSRTIPMSHKCEEALLAIQQLAADVGLFIGLILSSKLCWARCVFGL